MSAHALHRLVRIAAPLFGLAVLAVLLAGCGGGSGTPGVANIGTTTSAGTTTTGSSADSGADGTASGGASRGGATLQLRGGKDIAQFASCMRTHGEPNFPDPNAQGQVTISSGS